MRHPERDRFDRADAEIGKTIFFRLGRIIRSRATIARQPAPGPVAAGLFSARTRGASPAMHGARDGAAGRCANRAGNHRSRRVRYTASRAPKPALKAARPAHGGCDAVGRYHHDRRGQPGCPFAPAPMITVRVIDPRFSRSWSPLPFHRRAASRPRPAAPEPGFCFPTFFISQTSAWAASLIAETVRPDSRVEARLDAVSVIFRRCCSSAVRGIMCFGNLHCRHTEWVCLRNTHRVTTLSWQMFQD